MQNKSKLPHAQAVDARLPLALCYAIGVILLSALEALCYLMDPTSDAVLYGLVLLTFFVVVMGCVLLAYLLRVRRLHEVQAAADDMTTEIGDVFKYVIDIPYAISDAKGNVKVINRALQDILAFNLPFATYPCPPSAPFPSRTSFAVRASRVSFALPALWMKRARSSPVLTASTFALATAVAATS